MTDADGDASQGQTVRVTEDITVTLPIEVTSMPKHIYAETADGYEVFYWHHQEWERDPSLVPIIADMVQLASDDPVELIRREEPHIISDYQIKQEDI